MIQTDYCPDKFGTYLSHPESLDSGICNDHILRRTSWETATAQSSCTATSSVSNYDRYLHSLLKEIGEEFNYTVITEVKVGGIVNRSEEMFRPQISQDLRAVHYL